VELPLRLTENYALLGLKRIYRIECGDLRTFEASRTVKSTCKDEKLGMKT